MSVTDRKIVDGIAIGHNEKTLMMLIADHLDWEKEYEHLLMLQSKVNDYIEFIESKQYAGAYPEKRFDTFCIQINFMYGPSENCNKFIDVVNKQLADLQISVVTNVD